mmetsp:Transcript_21528/g.36970  ORF Transcript_21528/g.36970 Transcript_21528/m.36970 type:complete len:217 (-) Transcript_21528:42-692(-)
MRRMSTVLSDGDIFLRSCRVSLQFPPWGPVATKLWTAAPMRAETSSKRSASTDPSASTAASPTLDAKLPEASFSCNCVPNLTKSAFASRSSARRFSSLASSSASLRSRSLCLRMLPNAQFSDRSHFSRKSTSIPDLSRARMRSAPAESCMSSLRISSARFHNFPAEHGRRFFSPEEQCVKSLGTVYRWPSSSICCCSSRATSSTAPAGMLGVYCDE